MIQVAVNKPSGLQVLPGGLFQQRTVLTQLQWRSHSNDKQATHGIAALHEKDLWKPSPVHRLGRGTSGLSLILNIIIIHRHFGPWNRLTISA
jgi:23S rRNA-/tRNA-specific pseudouridylate synthase